MDGGRRGFTLQAPRVVAAVLIVLLAVIAVPAVGTQLAKRRERARLVAETG